VKIAEQWSWERRADGESCPFRVIDKGGSGATTWVCGDEDVSAQDIEAHWITRNR
jgi:hypothetical protein